jgi:hypothetical protein
MMLFHSIFFKIVLVSMQDPTDDAKLQVVSILVSGVTAAGIWLLGLGQKRWTALNRVRFVLISGLTNINAGISANEADFIKLAASVAKYFETSFQKYSNELLEVHRDTQRHIENILMAATNANDSKLQLSQVKQLATTDALIMTSSAILAVLYSNRQPQFIDNLLNNVVKALESDRNQIVQSNRAELMRYFLRSS